MTHDQRCHHWSRCAKNSVFRRIARPSRKVTTVAPTAAHALNTDTSTLAHPIPDPSIWKASRAERDHGRAGGGSVETVPGLLDVED